jgi:hypothetical protein
VQVARSAGERIRCRLDRVRRQTLQQPQLLPAHRRSAPPPPNGRSLGALLIGYAAWGRNRAVRDVLIRAVITGAAAAILGAVPGLMVLGFFLGGVAPHAFAAVLLIPSLFVVGAAAGGAVGYVKARRGVPPESMAQ